MIYLTEYPGISFINQILQKAALLLIRVYQVVLSPLLGPSCRFYPTCSEYARQAILRYGVIKGAFLSLKRLMRCHPFHRGGYDPVP